MSILHYLENEENYLPWKAALSNFETMSRRLNASEFATYEVRADIYIQLDLIDILTRPNFAEIHAPSPAEHLRSLGIYRQE